MGSADIIAHVAAVPPSRRLFISYAHADRAKVKPIVEALSALGHIVWWDSHLAGGTSFAEKIADELNRADTIIVMWSALSTRSHWVLDEAGRGRDSGRLIPILLDGTLPPLGFGQLQAIDFSHWHRATDDAPMNALAQAISGNADAEHHAGPAARPQGLRRLTRSQRLILAAAALLVLVAGLGLFGLRTLSPAPAKALSIAVLPFADLSGTSDHFAEGISEEVLNALARDKELKVLGRTSSWSLKDKASDLRYLRATLGVGHLLEGSVQQAGARVRVHVRLITTTDGSEVWAEGFDRTGGDLFALQDEIGAKIAARLGSSGRTTHVAQRTTDAVFRDVVIAAQLVRTREVPAMEHARALMQAATAADPHYAPAWAMLARATLLLSNCTSCYGTVPVAQALATAQPAAEKAIALDPQLADGHAALGFVQKTAVPGTGIPELQRAIALDPQSVVIRTTLATAYFYNNQFRASIRENEAITAIDPLFAVPAANLVIGYQILNDDRRAARAVARFRAVATDPADIAFVEGQYLSGRGDLAKALAVYDTAIRANPTLRRLVRRRLELLQRMYAYDQVRATPDAKALLGEQYGLYAHALAADVPRILALPVDEFFHDWAAATVLTELGRERDIVRLFRARFPGAIDIADVRTWDIYAPALTARALAMAGDEGAAATLRNVARATNEQRIKEGSAPAQLSFELAMVAVGDGQAGVALDGLTAAFKSQWYGVCQGPDWIGTFPPFAKLRGDPRFEAVLAGCRIKINEQRRLAGMAPATLP